MDNDRNVAGRPEMAVAYGIIALVSMAIGFFASLVFN